MAVSALNFIAKSMSKNMSIYQLWYTLYHPHLIKKRTEFAAKLGRAVPVPEGATKNSIEWVKHFSQMTLEISVNRQGHFLNLLTAKAGRALFGLDQPPWRGEMASMVRASGNQNGPDQIARQASLLAVDRFLGPSASIETPAASATAPPPGRTSRSSGGIECRPRSREHGDDPELLRRRAAFPAHIKRQPRVEGSKSAFL